VAHKFEAPQANLMFVLTQGIMDGNLPWMLVIAGMGIAAVVEMMDIGALPFAIGLYLPLNLSTTIVFGGLIHWAAMRFLPTREHKAANDRGLLAASGLVAGDALVGVGLGLMLLIPDVLKTRGFNLDPAKWDPSYYVWHDKAPWFVANETLGNIVTCGLFALLCVYLWRTVFRKSQSDIQERTRE